MNDRFSPRFNINEVAAKFITALAKNFKEQRIYLHHHNFRIYSPDKIGLKNTENIDTGLADFEINKSRFIYGDLPLGLRLHSNEKQKDLKIGRRNWLDIYKATNLLSDDGLAVFAIEPSMWSKEWNNFEQELLKINVHLKALVRFPERDNSYGTAIRLNFAVFSKKAQNKLFIADPGDEKDAAEIAKNLISDIDSSNLSSGIFVDRNSFIGFENYLVSKSIEKLNTEFKEYKQYKLSDLAMKIQLGRTGEELSDDSDSIFIPQLGTSDVVASLGEATIKHQNLIKVTLNSRLVLPRYAAIYFRSEIGKLSLQSVTKGFIPRVSRNDLSAITIAVPTIKEQEDIINTEEKLRELSTLIDRFSKELSLNPKKALEIQEKVSSEVGFFESLNDEEEVRTLVRNGETKKVEFKETFSYDKKSKKKEQFLEKSALKTVAAFLNTSGGVLLIGVTDEGEIVGINEELSKFYKADTLNKSKDKFKLHLKDLIKSHIGESFHLKVNYELVDISDFVVCKIDVEEAEKPCFYQKKEFFIRTNPATDKIEGQEQHEYIQQRFKK